MPSISRGKTYVTQEVKPSTVNLAPSSPPGSPSTKKARFATAPIEGVSRPLSRTEEWSMYHYEVHARQCDDCYTKSEGSHVGRKLCDTGLALAKDVAEHVYHHAGDFYSTKSDSHKLVRVELPPNYSQTRFLLRNTDRAVRSTTRTAPVISYEPITYPVPRRRSPSPERRRRRFADEEVAYIQPGKTETDRRPHRRSTHKSRRYSTVVINDDVEADLSRRPEVKSDTRRGSLYDADIQRLKKDKGYVVEIREPEPRRYRESERRRYA